jgi:hypothetical protein
MTMANDGNDGLSGSELQQSQSGGASGDFGGDPGQPHAKGMQGGGPSKADMSQAGGSSGTGGYGDAQNVANHQGQGEAQSGLAGSNRMQERAAEPGQSRGERFDQEQGGGRSADTLDSDSPEEDAASAFLGGEQAQAGAGDFEREES